MPKSFLDNNAVYPVRNRDGSIDGRTVHLSRIIDHPNLIIGDFTYATSHSPPDDWANHLAPYTYAGAPEKLHIGKFCQIADRVRIITASANHAMRGISTYPFAMYDRDHFSEYLKQLEPRRDTVIGNDVWIGDGATILPGARVGSGVIVGAGAVVRGVVPNYAIVSGNPAQIVKMRFTDFDIARIVDLAWWDWPIDAIEEAAPMLARSDIAALEALKAKISA
jgi:virginiamycin A acetyltransferase